MACPSGYCIQPPNCAGGYCGPATACGFKRLCSDTEQPFSCKGFYPLYFDSWSADAVSPQGSSHTHTFRGCVYYMPNGLVRNRTYYHGNFIEGEFSVARMISSTAQLSMFYSGLQDTGLVALLAGPKNYTVFAPTNDAWLRLPERFVRMLFLPRNAATLKDILLYHIIGTNLKTLGHGGFKTLEGSTVSITSCNACNYKINEVDIRSRIPPARNGTVYLIEEVLLPPTLNIAAPLD